VVSAAHGARLRELGLPGEKTSSLPNFIPTRQIAEASRAGEGAFALVAGRLVEEKGYDTAIHAARAAGVPLLVAGAGPDEPRLRRLAAGADVRFAGLLTPAALADQRRRAAVVLVPSRCEEACPYAVLDAFAAGIPVLGSARGGVPELVGPAAALDPEDPDAWAEALAALWKDAPRRDALGNELLSRARQHLGEERYYERLMGIYAPG
jgi:glycosyltransferase involved in cell wall biosynthesis